MTTYPRYSRKRTYTRREYATLYDAYATLGAILIGLPGGSVKILDNLSAMIDGRRPRWDEDALDKARTKNHRAMAKEKGRS